MISVSFDMPLPDGDFTSDQIQEWVEYRLGYRGGIPMDNPLSEYDLNNADNFSVR